MNLPNKLTISRLVLVLVFAFFAFPFPEYKIFSGAFFTGQYRAFVALIVYIVASITDALDGHIARKNNLVTNFGKFLDPIADKLLVTSALLALMTISDVYLWATLIILAREFIVSAIRMMSASKGVVIPAGMLGKLKMIFQTIAIITLLVGGIVPVKWNISGVYLVDVVYILGNIILFIAVILTIVSGIQYVYNSRHLLSTKNND
ncbi:MAG: CDP-diacylglycerol--glycerol-3-phosphate 3-phosphatidyltransferase [Ruminococcaceae bacterium]|nr:CDP-diacylglycerol--glycerol-3-phosphate 3-phosphatidyltransferase [Oscillospiraceae bacterium]